MSESAESFCLGIAWVEIPPSPPPVRGTLWASYSPFWASHSLPSLEAKRHRKVGGQERGLAGKGKGKHDGQ